MTGKEESQRAGKERERERERDDYRERAGKGLRRGAGLVGDLMQHGLLKKLLIVNHSLSLDFDREFVLVWLIWNIISKSRDGF